MSERSTELQIVGIGVSDRDDTVNVISDVGFHVTNDGLDIVGRGLGRVVIENNLITGQERQHVIVSRENLNDTKNMFEVHRGVCCPGQLVVQMLVLKRGVDIKNQVDSSCSQHSHTLIVIGSGVHGINTNGVDAELLEEIDITGAGLWVGKRVTTLLDLR